MYCQNKTEKSEYKQIKVWYYATPMSNDTVICYVSDSIFIDGVKYYKRQYLNANFHYETPYHRDSCDVKYFNPITGLVSTLIPKGDILNHFFIKSSTNTWEIINYHQKLVTPVCSYTDLIEMRCTNYGTSLDVIDYFMRDVGLIAATIDGEFRSYLIATKTEIPEEVLKLIKKSKY
jgi:hypothetical protein